MNIYVVSSCWWRDGATVIGAGATREDAEGIAERSDIDDHRLAGWAPWKEDVSPAEGSCTWRRDALMSDGTTHASLYQEIVCVPLAGYIEEVPIEQTPFGRGIPALITRSEIAEIGRQFGAP